MCFLLVLNAGCLASNVYATVARYCFNCGSLSYTQGSFKRSDFEFQNRNLNCSQLAISNLELCFWTIKVRQTTAYWSTEFEQSSLHLIFLFVCGEVLVYKPRDSGARIFVGTNNGQCDTGQNKGGVVSSSGQHSATGTAINWQHLLVINSRVLNELEKLTAKKFVLHLFCLGGLIKVGSISQRNRFSPDLTRSSSDELRPKLSLVSWPPELTRTAVQFINEMHN